jgi:3-deoxy-D-manno-octulosonic-acid transferase
VIAGLEDSTRKSERFGIPSVERPSGRLIWIHAVSVGESLSVIPFINEFKKINPDVSILLTTTTIAASRVIAARLGDSVISQLFPFDVYSWIERFVDFWRPSLTFFVESEIWPNTLHCLHRRRIQTHLLNARVSQRTLRRMHIAKKLFSVRPFSLFESVLVPSRDMMDQAKILGAKNVILLPNMKILADKLPVNKDIVITLKNKFFKKKVWIACSSHKGEEEIIIKIHKRLKSVYTNLCTIIAPRHPERADEIRELCKGHGVASVKHTDCLCSIDEVYILDEIGRFGEFFEIVNAVLVCGSLVPGIGGHNILEPLRFGCSTATGQYLDNFSDIYRCVMNDCKMVFNEDDIFKFVEDSLERNERKEWRALDFIEPWIEAISQISLSLQMTQ